jgi:predicted restriction endonuclease
MKPYNYVVKEQTTPALVRSAAERFRARIVGRCLSKCEICCYYDPTWGELLRVHHIVHVSKGGRSSMANLIALCSNCHAAAHLFNHKKFQHGGTLFRPLPFDERVKIVMEYGYQFVAAEKMTLIASESVLMDRKGGIFHRLVGSDEVQTFAWGKPDQCPQPQLP